MESANIDYLHEHGPAPARDLPARVKQRDRRAGVNAFKFAGSRGPTQGGGQREVIYYLDEHVPDSVIRTFCDAHPSFVTSKKKHAFPRLFGNHGRQGCEAAHRIADLIWCTGRNDIAVSSIISGLNRGVTSFASGSPRNVIS